tara:strand:+ start:3735 stop:5057 length:1323 start_codon:yes stop_codon:yes gene_type:complete
VTINPNPEKIDLLGDFERSDAVLRWYDQEAGLKLLGFGCFAISTASNAIQDPLEFLIEGQCYNAADLFTRIKTKLPKWLWTTPIGFFALRFDAERMSESSPWCEWPTTLVQIPKRIIVQRDDQHAVDIRFELDKSAQDATHADEARVDLEDALDDEWALAQQSPTLSFAEESVDFQSRVSEVEKACRREIVDKIVVARSTHVPCEKTKVFCPRQTYAALVTDYPGTTVFSLRQGRRYFMGATPETLVRVTESRVTTHALAGTAIRNPESMLSDDKIRREHSYVVDDIQASLDPLCDELQIETKPTIRPANNLFHLQTKVVGIPKAGYSIFDFVGALHPTPALCGLPRQDSMAWLRRTEPLDRGFFGGPIGLFDASGQGGVCAVAIRSGLLSQRDAIGFAGAGIVTGSNPRDEWTETEAKLGAFRSALRTVTRLDPRDTAQ